MMNQNEFGKLIREIRKKNNLTQKELADKYHVTYQAVSKWENGKNMPDVSLMKEISKDFNVSINDMLDGKYNGKKNRKWIIITYFLFFVLLFIILGVFFFNRESDFEFKTLSSNCDNFSISGSIAYNKKKPVTLKLRNEYTFQEIENIFAGTLKWEAAS